MFGGRCPFIRTWGYDKAPPPSAPMRGFHRRHRPRLSLVAGAKRPRGDRGRPIQPRGPATFMAMFIATRGAGAGRQRTDSPGGPTRSRSAMSLQLKRLSVHHGWQHGQRVHPRIARRRLAPGWRDAWGGLARCVARARPFRGAASLNPLELSVPGELQHNPRLVCGAPERVRTTGACWYKHGSPRRQSCIPDPPPHCPALHPPRPSHLRPQMPQFFLSVETLTHPCPQ